MRPLLGQVHKRCLGRGVRKLAMRVGLSEPCRAGDVDDGARMTVCLLSSFVEQGQHCRREEMVCSDVARVLLTPGLRPVLDHPFTHSLGVGEVNVMSFLACLVFGGYAGIVDENVNPARFTLSDFGDQGANAVGMGEVS